MSKMTIDLEALVRVVILVLLAVLLLTPGLSGLVILVFVPVAGWLLWHDRDKIVDLERRLAALEKPGTPKSDEA